MLDFNNFKENLEVLGEDIFLKISFCFWWCRFYGAFLTCLILDTAQNDKGLEFQVAHVNYHFRGEDSNLDQKL